MKTGHWRETNFGHFILSQFVYDEMGLAGPIVNFILELEIC